MGGRQISINHPRGITSEATRSEGDRLVAVQPQTSADPTAEDAAVLTALLAQVASVAPGHS